MTALPRVLVTGATGKTGRATVLALIEHHSDVVQTRALVRTDDHRARALRDAGAEVVIGDMSDIRDLRRAMSGVQRAHLVVANTNNSLDHALNFVVAAAAERLEHVVAIGQWLASESHPSLMTRRTSLVDQVLRWIPEVDHTVINVGFFADNIMSGLGIAAQLGVLSLPLGRGATAVISNEDIGRVVAGVLSNPAPYAGRTLRPTGPQVLTPEDIAAVFGEVLGREVRYVEASERMALKSLRAEGRRAPFEQAQVVHYLREYRRGTFAAGGATNVVAEVTGRPAEDLTTIVRRYALSDPLARRSLPNLFRAVAQTAKVMLTRPLDLKRWERENDLPTVDGEDSIDVAEWNRTHAVPNAFGV
ncbi:NmrA family NAD(P)-binding protein [Rhodococcus marinonascens]|uniref:NmrA family NAD(P)-binding protein n=1 Tax=Rhodococcus marinonascens TaxID=38311 RepID=UPI0009329F2F|nr:NmrA family NAD(P)-binding protein [Rhodococcus marinonascens]